MHGGGHRYKRAFDDGRFGRDFGEDVLAAPVEKRQDPDGIRDGDEEIDIYATVDAPEKRQSGYGEGCGHGGEIAIPSHCSVDITLASFQPT